jgi:hypothetical protein
LTGRGHEATQFDVHLDVSTHVWKGEDNLAGKVSLYRGPILLTFGREVTNNELDALGEVTSSLWP